MPAKQCTTSGVRRSQSRTNSSKSATCASSGMHVAVERGGNVVQPQPEMIFRRDAARPVDADFVAEQRHDVARAGVLDGFVQARQRADVNHRIKTMSSLMAFI